VGLMQGRETIASFSLTPPKTQRSQRKSFAVIFDFLQRNHILINEVLIPKSCMSDFEEGYFLIRQYYDRSLPDGKVDNYP
jgi:hypothetical protein